MNTYALLKADDHVIMWQLYDTTGYDVYGWMYSNDRAPTDEEEDEDEDAPEVDDEPEYDEDAGDY